MFGLALAIPHTDNIVVTIVFSFLGWVMWIRDRMVKAR